MVGISENNTGQSAVTKKDYVAERRGLDRLGSTRLRNAREPSQVLQLIQARG